MPEVWKDWKETWKTTPLPKHLQFAYTILREAMLPDEKCNIDPEIRKIVNRFKRAWVISKSSSWDLSDRLESIWKYLEPTYKKLLEEDIKNIWENNKVIIETLLIQEILIHLTQIEHLMITLNEIIRKLIVITGMSMKWSSKDWVMDKVKKDSGDVKQQEDENIKPKNPFDDTYEDIWENTSYFRWKSREKRIWKKLKIKWNKK